MNEVTYSNQNFTSKDGYQLFQQSWLIDNPKAVVLIVHGLGEHSSRYAHVAAHLNANGYAVYSYDQQGHGQSEGRRSYIDSFDTYRTDLLQMINRVRLNHADVPLFTLAHSMGGEIMAYTAVRDMPKLDGVIFSSAALVPGDDISPMLIKVANVLGRFLPKVPTTKLDSNSISRDPVTVQNYDSDPLNYHGGIPARTAAEMLRGFRIIEAGTPTINYPMLIFHGSADAIVNVEGSMQLYARAGSKDKTLKIFEGAYHEVLNGPDKQAALNLITNWLDAHLTTAVADVSHHQKRASRSEKPDSQADE
jgi:alpha-beta hydrolase superfamily lysophospholipase